MKLLPQRALRAFLIAALIASTGTLLTARGTLQPGPGSSGLPPGVSPYGTWVPNLHTPQDGQPFLEPPPGHCPTTKICADWEDVNGVKTSCCIDPEDLGSTSYSACKAWRGTSPYG